MQDKQKILAVDYEIVPIVYYNLSAFLIIVQTIKWNQRYACSMSCLNTIFPYHH